MHASQYKAAHQTSARYETGISEFDEVGFKELYHPSYYAPFVADAVVKIAMKFEDRIPVPLNGTALIVGSVKYIELADEMVGTDGFVDLSGAEVLISQGLDAYFVTYPIGRLAYAKP